MSGFIHNYTSSLLHTLMYWIAWQVSEYVLGLLAGGDDSEHASPYKHICMDVQDSGFLFTGRTLQRYVPHVPRSTNNVAKYLTTTEAFRKDGALQLTHKATTAQENQNVHSVFKYIFSGITYRVVVKRKVNCYSQENEERVLQFRFSRPALQKRKLRIKFYFVQ